SAILRKTEARNRVEAALIALRAGRASTFSGRRRSGFVVPELRNVRDETFDGVFGAERSAAQRRSESATAPMFPGRVRPCSRAGGPGVDLGGFLWSFSEDEVGGWLADLGAHRSEVARLDVGPGRRNVREVLQSVLGD